MQDSFTFVDIIKTLNLTLLPSFSALLPFQVHLLMSLKRKLFKSVLTLSTNSLEHPSAPFPQKIFVELREMATSVEFNFDDIMHRQIHRVAKGSPLQIFLLATMNLNFSRPLPSRICITALWMTLL